MPQRLAIIASHVIQYQDPFFRLLAADPEIDLTVLYLSNAGAQTYRDEDMGTTLRWDVDLLTGYHHLFLRNLADNSNRGWTRHINPGLVPALLRGHYDMVIFMLGWGSISAMLGILTCRLAGIPFFLYGDSSFPPPEDSVRPRIRARLLRLLFRNTTGFMVSGVLNAGYYRHYGADPSHFFLLPWAVDNERFEKASHFATGERERMRESLGIQPDQIVFVFSAKLVERKDPMTLLRAYEQMRDRDRAVILFLGDGILRELLESHAREHQLSGARFAGFVNQSELPKYYGLADVFVLPSTYEPRGAVINEAMACGLPVIVTDRCGSVGDIVLEDENAFIYPSGDAAALAASMTQLVDDPSLRLRMAERSRQIIDTWTFSRGVEGVKAAALSLDERRQA
ncbi:MAG TPA: glycosyltransferase family 4 protein [Thermoanaerobaculia bacterium]|nr:glycosyltransferase family 4 protein [Thermoanaerobaculia bacterium]